MEKSPLQQAAELEKRLAKIEAKADEKNAAAVKAHVEKLAELRDDAARKKRDVAVEYAAEVRKMVAGCPEVADGK